jgi:hypothetical protein
MSSSALLAPAIRSLTPEQGLVLARILDFLASGDEVFLTLGHLRPHEDIAHARWLYTALTRATRQLNIAGWPSLHSALRRSA